MLMLYCVYIPGDDEIYSGVVSGVDRLPDRDILPYYRGRFIRYHRLSGRLGVATN